MSIQRFGVSLDKEVLAQLDKYVKENNYPNRSQAIRFLVEEYIVENKWKSDELVAGAIVLLYNHHKSEFISKLTNLQHEYYQIILSTQHFHIDHDNCLEIIAVKGKASIIQKLSDTIITLKGIIHGKLVMSKTI